MEDASIKSQWNALRTVSLAEVVLSFGLAWACASGTSSSATPANDNFENATVLSGTNITVTGSNAGATTQAGEPVEHENSVWYTWTAPVDGFAAVWSPFRPSGRTVGTTRVYSGTSVSGLTSVPNLHPSGGYNAEHVFAAVAGQTYRIAVQTRTSDTGPFRLHLLAAPGAQNDDFANAVILTGTNAEVATIVVNASVEPGEPNPCSHARTVWWSWKAPFSGNAYLVLQGEASLYWNNCFAVYEGASLTNLVRVVAENDASKDVIIHWKPRAGITYRISHVGAEPDVVQFKLSVYLEPPNDHFASRVPIPGTNAIVGGYNFGATREAGEPLHGETAGGKSVWWTWTAQGQSRVRLSTEGSDFDTVLSVYRGSSLPDLIWVATDDDSGSNHTSKAVFDASPGETYAIAVSGHAGPSDSQAEDEGRIVLQLQAGVPVLLVTTAPALLPRAKFTKEGRVNVLAVQPDGKVIAGGVFSSVNGVEQLNLARFNENGSADLTWTPSVSGDIEQMLVYGDYLYVATSSRTPDYRLKSRLSRIGLRGGAVDPNWTLEIEGSYGVPVQAMAAADDFLFVGGTFTSIGGVARTNLAKVSVVGTAAVDSDWRPDPRREVNGLLVYENVLVVSGGFDAIASKVFRDGAGAVDTAWQAVRPNPYPLYAYGPLEAAGTTLFIGAGDFDTYLIVASVSLLPGTNTISKVGLGGERIGGSKIEDMEVVGDSLFVAVSHTGPWAPCSTADGYNTYCLHRFTLPSGLPAAGWDAPSIGRPRYRSDPMGNGVPTNQARIYALARAGNQMLIGGNFSSVAGEVALGLAMWDPLSGQVERSFSAQVQRPGDVLAMATQWDGKLVVGGEFVSVDALPRDNLARFNADGTLDQGWFPRADGAVTKLGVDPSGLFIGGVFRNLGGAVRVGLAKMSFTEGFRADPAWNPGLFFYNSFFLADLAVAGGKVYVAGDLLVTNHFAIVDAVNGIIEFSDRAEVTDILVVNGTVVVAGGFSTFAGLPRSGMARIQGAPPYTVDAVWNPNVAFTSYARPCVGLAASATHLFVGVGDYDHDSVLKIALAGTGALDEAWVPDELFSRRASTGGAVGILSLAAVENDLYVGGLFWPVGYPTTPAGGEGMTMLLRLDAASGVTKAAWNTGRVLDTNNPSTPVEALVVSGDNLYVGGRFARFGDSTHFGLALLPSPDAPTLIEEPDGRITVLRNPEDGNEITHFRVTTVSGGNLFKGDGTSPVAPGDFITIADGAAGLRFASSSGGGGSLTVASAVTTTSAGTGAAAATLVLQAGLVPTYSFSQDQYVVSEGASSVTITVTKRGQGSGTVRVATQAGTAVASEFLAPGDFLAINAPIPFLGTQDSLSFPVRLDSDDVFEGDEVFYMVLSEPSAGGRLGSPAQARILIVDNDLFGPEGSYITNSPPSPRPASAGMLEVQLQPSETGQWRLLGANDWHNSGEVIAGLVATNYQIEFKEVGGYQAPAKRTVAIEPSGTTRVSEAYLALTPIGDVGHLTVVISPPEVAANPDPAQRGRWRVVGRESWRASGEVEGDLAVGIHQVELNPLEGYFGALLETEIEVSANRIRTNHAIFVPAPGVGRLRPQVLSPEIATTVAPFQYNGQLRTSLGVGSGVVVKQGVVLTAAHLLFDDRNLEEVRSIDVHWRFQRQRGDYEPPPQRPYGFILLAGYAAQRTNDIRVSGVNPGYSTPGSQNLDVAALFFLEPAGRGGFGGFLTSEEPNEHLLSNRQKQLVGYPISGVAGADQGRLHATLATNLSFQLLYPSKSVYVSSDFASYPGNSGGPLYVETAPGGALYPVGVYIGQRGSGESLVRAIDEAVLDIINRAEELSNGGPNHPDTGVTPYIWGQTTQPFGTGLLTIHLGPAQARAAGAGWRFVKDQNQAYTTAEYGTVALTAGTDFELVFKAATGFIAPEKSLQRVGLGEISTLEIRYVAWPAELTLNRTGQLTLVGSNRGRYAIQYADRLHPPDGWQLWTNLTLSNRPQLFTLPVLTNVPQRFYRAWLLP